MTIDIFPTANFLPRPGLTPTGVTVSRGSTAWQHDALGVLVATAGPDALRDDYDRTSGAYRGWRIENAATNLLLNSLAPATQTVSVTTGTYTLSVLGTGSAALSGAASGTATEAAPVTVTCPADGTLTVTVTGTLNAFQLEAGQHASSMIATTTAPVTRNKDVLFTETTSLPLHPAEGTLYAEASVFGIGTAMTAADLGAGSPDNRLSLRFTAAREREALVVAEGVEHARLTLDAVAADTPTKLAVAFGPGSIAFCADGGAVVEAPCAALPVPQYLTMGINGGGSEPLNGHLRHLAYFPRRLSNDALQLLTR